MVELNQQNLVLSCLVGRGLEVAVECTKTLLGLRNYSLDLWQYLLAVHIDCIIEYLFGKVDPYLAT